MSDAKREAVLLERLRQGEGPALTSKAAGFVKRHVLGSAAVIKYQSVEEEFYMFQSEDKTQAYGVVEGEKSWTCDCPSYKFQTGTVEGMCKHIQALRWLLFYKYEIEEIDLTD